jgi:hypothetical protein
MSEMYVTHTLRQRVTVRGIDSLISIESDPDYPNEGIYLDINISEQLTAISRDRAHAMLDRIVVLVTAAKQVLDKESTTDV